MILPSEKRRKAVLFSIAGGVLAWAVIGGIILPMQEESERLDRKIREARRDLQKVTEMADRYIALSASLPQGMRGNAPAGPLLADVESIAKRMGIEKHIKRMSPSPSSRGRGEELAVNIADLPYPAFVELLQGLYESASTITVRRAKITPSFDNRNNLTVDMTLAKGI